MKVSVFCLVISLFSFCCRTASTQNENPRKPWEEPLYGNIEKIVEMSYFAIGATIPAHEYVRWYDQAGRLIKDSSRSLGDSPMYSETLYSYNAAGRLIGMVMYGKKTEFHYEKDRIAYIVREKFDSSGEDTLYYEYDPQGRVLVDPSSEVPAYYEYDSLGRVTCCSMYGEEDKFFYEPDGSYRKEWEMGDKEVVFYDGDGFPQKIDYYPDGEENSPPRTYVYRYEYDDNKNWVKAYLANTSVGEEKLYKSRTITYRK